MASMANTVKPTKDQLSLNNNNNDSKVVDKTVDMSKNGTNGGNKKSPTHPAKRTQKYFSNDMNVQRFLGIFSARYCWPQDYEEDDVVKSWSQVMIDQYDWFTDKMWPQVVKKVPDITADDTSITQITELLFALVFKDEDLLTVKEMQYFEAVIDIFNDEVIIGLMFWFKLCRQFNWRLPYARLIAGHKRRKQLLEVLCKELSANESRDCFTADDVHYFYSIIDCVCVQSLANNIITDNLNENQYFMDLLKTIDVKLANEVHHKTLMRQLSTFNVLTQELIGLVFTMISTDDKGCHEMAIKKLADIESLFGDRFIDIDDNIDQKDQLLREDIADLRNIQNSLDLVHKQYCLSNNIQIELKFLKKFYDIIDDKAFQTIRSNRFHYLSHILRDDSHENHCQLMDLLLTFADYYPFKGLIECIKPVDVIKNNLIISVAKQVSYYSSNTIANQCYKRLLYESLKACPVVDLKSRLDAFGLKPITEDNSTVIKTLFNQMTEEDTDVVDQLIQEIVIGAYYDCLQTMDHLLDVALDQNPALMEVVARILVNELNPLSSMKSMGTTIMYPLMLFRVMNSKTPLQMIDQLSKLIAIIIDMPLNDNLVPIVLLDEFFNHLIIDKAFATEEHMYSKFMLMKSLVELKADDKPWPIVQEEPAPVIVFLTQYLAHYWRQPLRKAQVIEMLNVFLDKRLAKKLTEDEFKILDELMCQTFKKYDDKKASTYKIYMVYWEPVFPKPIGQVINISHNIFHDQILHYAVATRDPKWISDVYPEYHIFTNDIKIAMGHILPALAVNEWIDLYKFLMLYYYTYEVVILFRVGIRNAIESYADKDSLVKCFMNLLADQVLTPIRQETVIRPISFEDYKYYELDLLTLFRAMSAMEYYYIPTELRAQLYEMLVDVAKRMDIDNVNPHNLYKSVQYMPPVAKEVVKKVFGCDFFLVEQQSIVEPGFAYI